MDTQAHGCTPVHILQYTERVHTIYKCSGQYMCMKTHVDIPYMRQHTYTHVHTHKLTTHTST